MGIRRKFSYGQNTYNAKLGIAENFLWKYVAHIQVSAPCNASILSSRSARYLCSAQPHVQGFMS